ncbi:MAG: hypothetical protein IPL99_12350 [Candidatus Competibacteraceae bacterium]|nr:hypothetical protein [Candidatus Competibacteraceae bacterium]
MLNEYETRIELCGAEYATIVQYEADDCPLIDHVTLQHKVKCYYNAAGEYAPHVVCVNMEITKLLDDDQLCAIADEIIANDLYRAKEARTEQRLLALEYKEAA